MGKTNFVGELTGLLNKYSKENGSDSPDFILADYLMGCLGGFDMAVKRREQWFTPKPECDHGPDSVCKHCTPNATIGPGVSDCLPNADSTPLASTLDDLTTERLTRIEQDIGKLRSQVNNLQNSGKNLSRETLMMDYPTIPQVGNTATLPPEYYSVAWERPIVTLVTDSPMVNIKYTNLTDKPQQETSTVSNPSCLCAWYERCERCSPPLVPQPDKLYTSPAGMRIQLSDKEVSETANLTLIDMQRELDDLRGRVVKLEGKQ